MVTSIVQSVYDTESDVSDDSVSLNQIEELLTQCDNTGVNALCCACIGGSTEVVRLLMVSGGPVACGLNSRSDVGLSPIMLGVLYGHPEIVRILKNAHADVSLCDFKGRTAMKWATILDDVDCQRILCGF